MNIPPFSNMTPNTKVLSGSTGAKLYKNTTDKKWVIKQSLKGLGGFEQVKTESVADDIYQALGIPVPIHFLDVPNKALILEYIDGKSLADATPYERAKAKEELKNGFIVDALLANWDVIGLLKDNILLPADGSPAVRIDNGGSLTFGAQGGKKPFNKIVTEIDTMRNKTISPQAAKIFGGLTDTDIDTQIKTIIVPNYELILSLTPADLKEVMKGRMDNLIERTVWTNAAGFKNTVQETSQPEFIPAVQAALIKYFKAGWSKNFKNVNVGPANNSDQRLLEFINKTLKDNEAVVSGGFMLKSIGSFIDEKSVDMDIYVPTAHTEEFRSVMAKLFDSTSVIKHVVSDFPGSFFKKNGIVSVSKYSKTSPQYAEMDIVEINEDGTPIDVVKNFDLTFCENWYDGENVWMAYPDHVKTKAGFLENHYLNILFTGNPVLIGRMKKYISRGFKISINNPVTKKAENVTTGIKNGTLFQQQIQNTAVAIPKTTHYVKHGIHSPPPSDRIPPPSGTIPPPSGTIPLNDISNAVTQPVKHNLLNMPINNNYPNSNLTNFSSEFSSLTRVDIQAIRHYTGAGYENVNRFLYTDMPCDPYNSVIYKWIKAKFPLTNGETNIEYNKRITYYYFVNLYNAIQKVPNIGDKPIKLYRGTHTWYLPKNTEKFYYLNSFSSTSVTQRIAATNVFTSAYSLPIGSSIKRRVYVFYVHPKCTFANITPISRYREDEILLNPYNRYLYMGENKSADGKLIYRNYAIFPPDIDIPTTYSTFMPWKKGIVDMTTLMDNGVAVAPSEPLPAVPIKEEESVAVVTTEGGRVNNTVQVPETLTYRYKALEKKRANTQRKLKSRSEPKKFKPSFPLRTFKMKSTRANTSKKPVIKPVADENMIRRFTDPLPSFPGRAPTAAEMADIKKMVAFFKNSKK